MEAEKETMTLMVVDDSPSHYRILAEKLRNYPYKVVGYDSASQALKVARAQKPDIILLDVMMPEMSGFEFCKKLKREDKLKEIPVIFCSALEDVEEKTKAFDVGGADYMTKPLPFEELVVRIDAHIRQRKARQALEDKNCQLNNRLEEMKQEVCSSREATVISLVELARSRDNDTGYHIERTQFYCKLFAEKLRESKIFKEHLDDGFASNIYHAAALHDIGKVAIPDVILLKPDKLSVDEFEVIKGHSRIGGQILKLAAEKYNWNDYLNMGADIALYHHEKWDGTGYPEGLAGGDIPISAHIMAFADVYDALRAERVYKKPFSHSRSVEIIAGEAGRQFDPQMTEAFLEIEDIFAKTYDKLN